MYNMFMKRRTMAQRFKIPLEGDPNINFYTMNGLILAKGYSRIVIGGRGPYIEFEDSSIVKENIYVPPHAQHKLKNTLSYYHEYRSRDGSWAKLYFQRMEVSYADYKIGKWYIDPIIVKTDEFEDLLLPMYYQEEIKEEVKKPNIFDTL